VIIKITKAKMAIAIVVALVVLFCVADKNQNFVKTINHVQEGRKFIKYVEFNANYDALEKALNFDIKSQKEEIKLNWIDILSYLAAKYGGNFNNYKYKDMENVVKALKKGENIQEISKGMKTFSYYKEAYSAILGGFVGKYKVEVPSSEDKNKLVFEERYGLKVFSPIAKTYPFQHYKDFGSSRSYGYSRPHLGHDLMAATGTPVVAVESGKVECLGWNQYGGWRIGIRSFDKKRYYYYAHLRKNRPYHAQIKIDKVVRAGEVIGYVGRTGYSQKENANNIETSHLHIGLQLIFDESQKECDNEIWINLYAITQILQKNKSGVKRNGETKEYDRQYDFWEKSLQDFD
jgi:murein DD-endopeptidase MepM/ murein hydrolase activator NlpD